MRTIVQTPVPTEPTIEPTTVPTTTINYSATIAEMQKQIADLNAKNEKTGNWIDIWQTKGLCGDNDLGMNYVEHLYLWGKDGFLTKRYDVSFYFLGVESVKTDISKFEFETDKQPFCSISPSQNQPTTPTLLETTSTAIQTPTQTPIPTIQHKITDGYWCRYITNARECFQFFSDGTYAWGYSPGGAMGKSLSCPGDLNAKCEYSFNSKGQYEIQGGRAFILSGDTLFDPHDYPSYEWSLKGIS